MTYNIYFVIKNPELVNWYTGQQPEVLIGGIFFRNFDFEADFMKCLQNGHQKSKMAAKNMENQKYLPIYRLS